MKLSITLRSHSEARVQCRQLQTDLSDNSLLNQTNKLTHWPSRYKQGIKIINSRKKIETLSKPMPICLGFSNSPSLFLRKRIKIREAFKPSGYIKRLTVLHHLENSPKASMWVIKKAPKIQLALSGKALSIMELQSPSTSPNKLIRSIYRESCSKVGKIMMSTHEHESNIDVSPWE